MGKKKGSYQEYSDEMGKAKDGKCWEVYEKYAKDLQFDIKNQRSEYYWKVHGEAVEYYGNAEIFESRESLQGKALNIRRNSILNGLLNESDRTELLDKYPKKCPKCGFHRFFGIRIEYFGPGKTLDFFCPSCDWHFEVVGSEGW